MIPETVARLRKECGLPIDPSRRGPVPLNRFFEEMSMPSVAHYAIPTLTLGKIEAHLRSEGVEVADLGEPNLRVDGLLFRLGGAAWAYVYVSDDERNPLPRRRFTAAHELGHALLHGNVMGRVVIDETIEANSKDPIEREANRFAVELLMPAEVCRERAEELRTEYHACPRSVLIYRLAAELLVSAEALRYRLDELGVGDD